MLRTKAYLLFLTFVFCLLPGIADAIGISSFQPPNGYLISKADRGMESARFMTDEGSAEVEGQYSYFRYHTNQKKPYSARKILEHYMRLLKNAGGEIIWGENTSLSGKYFSGRTNINGEETWISVEVKDLRNYDVSILERSASLVPKLYYAQNTQAMIEEAEARTLLQTVDKTRQLQLDVSFKPGGAVLRSNPPQFERIALMMQMDTTYNFRIEAPVDVPAKGTSEERRLLAKARQMVIYDALVASGVPSSRLTTEYPLGQDPEEISRARIVLR